MYKLNFTSHFLRRKRKLTLRNSQLFSLLEETLINLSEHPQKPSLKTHKANSYLFGEVWSSRVTGDLRILWDFSEEDSEIIILFDIGGHSGGNKVYKYEI